MELKVPPVPLAVVFGAAMAGLSAITPWARFALPGSRIAACGLALLGFAIALAGVAAFRASKTTVNPLKPGAASTVVSGGVFRLSRNPMYLGLLLVLGGWAVYLSSSLAVLLLPAFVVYMNRFQIEPEERALLAKFGPSYSQYVTTVRRWL